MNVEIISTLLIIIGRVTILTSIIVQVVKTVTWDKFPTNFLALMVSEALTPAAGAAYAQTKGIAITWYLVFVAVVVGLLSTCAVVVSHDKLIKTFRNWPKKTGW